MLGVSEDDMDEAKEIEGVTRYHSKRNKCDIVVTKTIEDNVQNITFKAE